MRKIAIVGFLILLVVGFGSILLASVGCVRHVFLCRNAPLLEFLVTFFLVVFGKMEGKWCVTLSLTHPTLAVEPPELDDILRYGDYNLHPNSTFKRFAFDESSLDNFIRANPDRTYRKTDIDIPTDKLNEMYRHPDSGGLGEAIGIDVFEHPEFYDWFDRVHVLEP